MSEDERLSCPDCDFTAKNASGLVAHRRRTTKHGAAPQERPPEVAAEQTAELQERDDRIAVLESRQIRDYPAADQGAYLLQALSRLGTETVAVLVSKAGKDSILSEAAVAEVAQAEQPEQTLVEQPETADTAEEPVSAETPLPAYIQGRTEREGYKYLGALGMSVREAAGND